jgi:hypothetical protein
LFIVYLQLEPSKHRLSLHGLKGVMQRTEVNSKIKRVDPCDRSGGHIELIDAQAVTSKVAAVSVYELAAKALRHRQQVIRFTLPYA